MGTKNTNTRNLQFTLATLRAEVRIMSTIRRRLLAASHRDLVIPQAVEQLCTPSMVVMERLRGGQWWMGHACHLFNCVCSSSARPVLWSWSSSEVRGSGCGAKLRACSCAQACPAVCTRPAWWSWSDSIDALQLTGDGCKGFGGVCPLVCVK